MMRKTVVLNVVGLTPALLGRHTPRLTKWSQRGAMTPIDTVTPAVTCSVQATYLTGESPSRHGIVANGWCDRDTREVKFWRQSNRLIQAPKVWERAKQIDPTFTCANLFWWFNMAASADVSVTPRPMYPADGRKIPDIYTRPADLRDDLQRALGQFPLFNFWGPMASIQCSRWIAECAKMVEQRRHPTLTLVYLPHLDYNLQRLGPDDPLLVDDLRRIDEVCGDLIDFYESHGAEVIVLSEYGITPVSKPVHLNRALRERGWLDVRRELGRELLDTYASRAFAVADHQVAHVYVDDPSIKSAVRDALEQTPGVQRVLDESGKREFSLDHPRSGDFVAIAEPNAWFTYYYWLDDHRAPDFARTVDIHRKPGYDPVELFFDPSLEAPRLKASWKVMLKRLGFRALIDVIRSSSSS